MRAPIQSTTVTWMLLVLSAAGFGCSSSSSSNPPDASTDASDEAVHNDGAAPIDTGTPADTGTPSDAGTPSDGAIPSDGGDAGPVDAAPDAHAGQLCADDAGIFHGGPTTCNGATCAPGCACLLDDHRNDVACFCGTPGRGATCISPNCGSLFCFADCFRDSGMLCVPPEGADAGAADGGPLCADDAGTFSGAAGTCQGQTCAAGCACVGEGSGQAACMCQQALSAAGTCVAPTCGSIFCAPGCTCADAGTGACSCP